MNSKRAGYLVNIAFWIGLYRPETAKLSEKWTRETLRILFQRKICRSQYKYSGEEVLFILWISSIFLARWTAGAVNNIKSKVCCVLGTELFMSFVFFSFDVFPNLEVRLNSQFYFQPILIENKTILLLFRMAVIFYYFWTIKGIYLFVTPSG